MKQKILYSLLLLTTFLSYAQETVETVATAENEGWSKETKFWLLAILSLSTIILVLRTFRGKAEV